jgi:dTDP-4-dehydrorhamnose 3,5-epimerase
MEDKASLSGDEPKRGATGMDAYLESRFGPIEGVAVVERAQIVDDRGKVAHMLRCDDAVFEAFGEVYFSWVNPGKVKAWHLHKQMTLNYTCPYGSVTLVLYDDRAGSPTRGNLMALVLSPEQYRLVKVPPEVWNGFSCGADYPSLVCNCATIPHDPAEIVLLPPDDPTVPYDWATGALHLVKQEPGQC